METLLVGGKGSVSKAAKRAGRRLRILRKQRNLSVTEVGEATGIDRSNVARYERGVGETALRRYELLAKFYGVTLADLFAPTRRRSQ